MDRYRTLRYFAYTLEALVLFMLQGTPDLIPSIFDARPVLLLPAAVSIAMFESPACGIAFGTLYGLLLDFGIGNTLGFHAVLLASICFGICILAADLIRTNFLTAMLLVIITATAVLLLQWLFYYAFSGYSHGGYALVRHYLPRLAYTILTMPILYYFNRALTLHVREAE